MSKVELKQLNVDDEIFKRIKKHKRTIYTLQDNNLDLQKGQTIIIANNINNKRLKRNIIKVYPQENLTDLKAYLKRKSKYLYPKVYENNSKLTAIEFKYNKNIFLKTLLIILIIILIFSGYRLINKKIDEANVNKFSNIIKKVSKERVDYVFVEINPSFVLTIKDNKVSDVACLNNDCLNIYNDIDIKGKSINESIDNLYNISKEKGFDTSNGVKVKTSDNVSIESKEYITIEYIDTTKEKELLNEVKNNYEIKNINNDNYYSKLWEELKKDPNYDDVYTCNMNDSKELECYIILKTGINKDSDYNMDTSERYNLIQEIFTSTSTKMLNTLMKFNFDVRDNKVYVNDIEFGYVPLFTLNDTPYKNVLSAQKIDVLDNGVCDYGYAQYENGICQVNDGVYIIPLEKVNLVNPTSAVNNMITHSYGLTEKTLKNYEFIYEAEKSQREYEERVERCIPIIESKGVYCCNSKVEENDICGPCSNRSIELLNDNTMFCHADANGNRSCGMMNQTFKEYCD